MSFDNGNQIAATAAKLPWLVKGGLINVNDRWQTDDSKPNNWLEYEDNAAGTGKIHVVSWVDASNLTRFLNPNGVNAFGMAVVALATPATPTITNVGTAGVVTWAYKVVALSGSGASLGSTPASAAGSTTTGNATETSANYNVITWAAVAGAVSYDVYRTTAGTTPSTTGKIGNVLATVVKNTGLQPSTYSLNDTALAGDGTTAPTANTTGILYAPVLGNYLVLTTPVNVVVTPKGTAGATSYSYKVVARSAVGTTAASTAGSTTTGNATLSTTNFNAVTWNAVPGAVSYDVYRTVGAATQGLIANVLSSAALLLNDTGIAGDSSTAPTVNTTGGIQASGGVTSNAGATVLAKAPNFISSETGSNNAIAGALVDSAGVAVPLAAGLRVVQVLAHTLQAGANAYVFNTVSKSIKKHTNAATDLSIAYAATGIIDMTYDGTQWLDMSQ
jgi:hypothetical protein